MLKRYDTCASLRLRNLREPFLDRIVTCHDKRILYENRRRSAQWLDKNNSPKEMRNQVSIQKRIHGDRMVDNGGCCPLQVLEDWRGYHMVTSWWTMAGVVRYKFLKTGEAITKVKYGAELEVVHQVD
ncbi:unnamed protein product [Heligmosomoides polygyrus]|uniref:Uncharacterized protein n=1 Tax=Heligmosomoides polygyrus TaxID=6339 RepID=A0A183FF87_HELPZ|nr:unnamed protein product [Heligmosomoides polygyrus]